MGRAITRADFETVYSMIAPEIVQTFNDVGGAMPTIAIFNLDTRADGHIRHGEILGPNALQVLGNGCDEADEVQVVRKGLTTAGSMMRRRMIDFGMMPPDIVVHIAEGTSTVAAHGDARREDCIVISMHAIGYSIAALCPIRGEPRRATLVPLPAGPTFVGDRLSMTQD